MQKMYKNNHATNFVKAFLLTIVVTFAFISNANAQTYFSEGFEGTWYLNGNSSTAATAAGPNAPSGWVQSRIGTTLNSAPGTPGTSSARDWAQQTWSGSAWASNTPPNVNQIPYNSATNGPTGAHGGSSVLWMNDGWFGSSTGASRRMESPAFDLTASASPVVSFWYYYSSGTATVAVVASRDGGTTWNTISSSNYTGGITTWTNYKVAIPAQYKVANAKIGILLVSNSWGSNDIFIDDVQAIEGNPPSAAPITLTYTSITATTTTLNWIDNSTDETAFRVYRSTDGTNYSLINTVASTTTAATGGAYSSSQTGLTAGIMYYYRIVAYKAEGETAPLSGSQATTAGVTYYYTGAATGDIATSTSWNTNAAGTGSARTSPATTDILIIDGAGTTAGDPVTLTINASVSIGALRITNSTPVTFQSGSTTTRTLTITGSAGDAFSIGAGSSLIINHASQAAAIAFSTGTGMTGTIDGTLTLGGSTSNAVTTTGGTGTVVTVSSTGIVNLTVAGSTTQLTGSATSLIFANGSNCNITGGSTTALPGLPLATWGANSNVLINSTALTSGTSASTNAAQSFGNFTYNCPNATGIMSWFTSNTVTLQGVLTIQATNTGSFRAVTSGTLTLNSNLVLTAGTFQAASSSSGTVIVLGNTTINGGTLDINTGTLSQRGTTFTNNGTLTGTASTATLQLYSPNNSAQTYTGTGTVTTNIGVISVQNTGGLTISTTNQTPVLRVNLFQGAVTGSGKITIGTGAALATTVQIGATGLTTTGGSFDANPIMNLGTGTYTVLYQYETAARTTGYEIPTTRTVSAMQIGNSNNVTLNGGNINIGTLALQAGNFTTSSSNIATITGTTTTSITRTSVSLTSGSSSGTTITVTSTSGMYVGMNVSVTAGTGAFAANTTVTSIPTSTTFVVSATPTTTLSNASITAIAGWVKGPLALTLPASLATGSTYTFPIGKSGYNNFDLVNPTTNAGGTVVVQSEVFDANAGGTPGTLMSSLNTSRYWATSITSGSGNFTNTFVRLNDTRGTQDAIAASSTKTGAYNQQGGVSSTLATNSITTATTASTSIPGFYLMGNLAAASFGTVTITPAGNQCSNVARPISAIITPGGAAVTSATLSYQVNGGTVQNVTMTNSTGNSYPSANTWTGTIPTVSPANATVTWSITAVDGNSLSKSYTGTSYTDAPLFGTTTTASASANSLCNGSSSILTANLINAGTVILGTGTSTATSTDGTFLRQGNSVGNQFRTQYLFTASELSAAGLSAGNITGLTFDISGTGGGTASNLTFKMGHTSLTDLTTTYITGLSQVYSIGTYPATGVVQTGLQSVTFNTPFNWNGTSNIILEACSQLATSGSDGTLRSTVTSFVSTIKNNPTTSGCTATTGGGTFSERPNFKFAGNVASAITSTSWTLGGSTVGSTNPLTVTPPVGTNTYTATITASGCVHSTTPTVTVVVNALPDAPTFDGTSTSQCGTPITIRANSGADSVRFNLYTVASGGSPIATTTAYNLGGSTTANISVSSAYVTIGGNNDYYLEVVNLRTGCVSTRSYTADLFYTILVDVPTAITIGADATNTCQNRVQILSITSNTSNYNTFTWSSSTSNSTTYTNLYTNILATAQYAYTGDSRTTIYYKRSSAVALDTITVTGRQTSGALCVNAKQIVMTVNANPTVTNVTPSSTSTTCSGSGNVALSAQTTTITDGTVTMAGGSTTGTSGSANANTPIRVGNTVGNQFKVQYLYRASDLTAAGLYAGNISAITLNVNASGGGTVSNLSVKMANTSTSAFTSTTYLTPAFTNCLSMPTYPATGTVPVGANKFTFTTPFNWDGTSNILIEMCSQLATSGTAGDLTVNSTSYVAMIGNNPTPTACASSTAGAATYSEKPNIIFDGQTVGYGVGSVTWSWAANASANVSGGALPTTNSGTVVPTYTGVYGTTGTVSYTVTGTSPTSPYCATSVTTAIQTLRALPTAPVDSSSSSCGQPTFYVKMPVISSWTIKWYAVGGNTALKTSTTSNSYTPITYNTGTNSYQVTITDANGCESPRTTVSVSVTNPPVLTITNNSDTIRSCVNKIETITVTSDTTGLGFTSFSWSPNTNLYVSNTGTGTKATNQLTVYYRRSSATTNETLVLTGNAGACTATANVTLKVGTIPVISSVTPTPSTICSGSTVTLNGQSVTASSGDATIGAGTDVTTLTTDGTPYRTGNTVGNQFRNQFLITAAELAAAGLTSGNITGLKLDVAGSGGGTLSNLTIKMGHSSLTAMTATYVTGLSQVYTIATWPATGTLTTGLQSHVFTTPFNWDGTSNLVIEVCAQLATTGSAGTLRGVSTAFASHILNNPSTSGCSTTTSTTSSVRPNIILTGQVGTNNAGSYSWSWTASTGQTATGNPASITPINNGASNLSVTFTGRATTASSGCYTEMTSGAITVRPLPAAPVDSSISTQCGIPTFRIKVVAGATYKWYGAATGGTAINGATSNIYTPSTYTGGGATNTYWATVTNANGCESNRTAINVAANTPATIRAVASTNTTCSDGIITLTASAATIGNYSNFTWSPTTNLYTNSSATTPYTGGSSSVVYYKRSTIADLTGVVITLNVSDGATPACYNTDTVQVNINAKPNINTVSASPNPVCSGNAVSLNATAIGLSNTNITIGAGSSTSTSAGVSMFYGGYGGCKTQYIIKASELTAAGIVAGNITALGVDISSLGSPNTTLLGVGISMGATSLNALTSNIETVATNVYPSTDFIPALGINTFTFTTPYNWDGTSNIIISFCYSNATTSNSVPTVKVDAPGFTCSNARYVDSRTAAEVCSYTGSTTPSGWNGGSTTGTSRPKFVLSAVASADVTTNYIWGWKVGTVTVGSADAAITVNPSNTTLADSTITYTVTSTNPANGCSASRDTSVVVRPKPSIATTNNGSSVCGTPTFTATSAYSGVTYNWYSSSTGGTALQTSTNASYIYTGYTSSAGGTVNTLYVTTSKGGCETASRTSVGITSTTPPAVSITTSSGTSTVNTCQNRIETLTANGAGYTSYIWSPATNLYTDAAGNNAYDGTSSYSTIYFKRSTVTVSPVSYIVVANGGGCQNTNSVSFNVNMNPNMTTAVASPSTVCAGATVNLSATSISAVTGSLTIGDGSNTSTLTTDGTPYRMGNTVGNQFRNQFLLLASELSTAGLTPGNITGMSLNIIGAGGGTLSNLTIKMGHSSLTAMTTTYVASGLSQVYTIPTWPASGTVTTGLQTHTFTTPFTWDGTSNLVIEVCAQLATSGSAGTLSGQTTSFISHIYNNPSTTGCTTTTSTTSSVRPDITLYGQVGTNVSSSLTWTWDNGVTVIGSSSSTTTTTASTGISSYNVTAYNAATTCSNTRSTNTITVNPLPAAPTSTTATSQCGVPSYTVTSVSGMNYKWYTVATGGTAIAGATSSSYVYTGYISNANDTLWVSAINSSTGCEGTRTRIIVAVSNPPSLTLSSTGTVNTCQNRIQAISVSSTLSNFSNYAFSPITNLYVDAGATAAYTTGSNATTVYYKNPSINSADVITVTGTNTSAPYCVNTASVSFNVRANPVVDTLKISPNTGSICGGTTVSLNGISNSSISGNATLGSNGTTLGNLKTQMGLTPLSSYYGSQHSQYLILASSLKSKGFVAGALTGIGFDVVTKNSNTFQSDGSTYYYNGYTVKIAHSSLTTLTAAMQSPTFTTVYTNNLITTTGLNVLTFGTGGTTSSFAWDGTSNILLDVCFSNTSYSTTGNDEVKATATSPSYNAVYGIYQDGASLCGAASGTNTAGNNTTLPDITFYGQRYTNGASNFTWTWTNTIGSTISNGPSVTNVPNTTNGANLSYTATVTNASTSCSTMVTTPTQVLYASGVTPTISISTASSTICSGNFITFTASVYSGSNNATLQWRKNGSNIPGETGTTFVAQPNTLSTGDIITCYLNTNNPCSTPSTLTSNGITLTVNQSPSAATVYNGTNGLAIPGNALVYCNFGTQYPFYVNAGQRNGTWSVTDATVATINSSNTASGLSSSGNIQLLKNGNTIIRYSLPSTVNNCITNTDIAITVAKQDKPNASTTTSNTVCVGNSLSFSNTTPGGVWSSEATATINSSGVLTALAPATVSKIYYTVTNISGCSNRDTFNLAIKALPGSPSATFAAGTANPYLGAPSGSICANRTFTLVGIPSGGVWSSLDVSKITINPATGVVNTIAGKSGAVSLAYKITDGTTGCSNTKVFPLNIAVCATKGIINNILSAKDNSFGILYPNPAKNIVNIRMDMLVGKAEVMITDVLGKNVKSQILGLGNNEIDITSLSAGIYMVNITTTSGKQIQKLVVE